jgi:hypothetical protein
MKYKIKNILLILLITLVVILLFKLLNSKKADNHIINNAKIIDIDDSILRKMMFLQIESENYKIDNDIYINSLYGDSLKLSEVIGNKPKLIFYLDQNICNSCVEDELQRLSKYNMQGENNLLVISVNGHKRDLFILDRKYKLNGKLFTIESSLGIPTERSKQPFLFILQGNQISNVFIPNKNIKDYSTSYHNIIGEKYFKDDY